MRDRPVTAEARALFERLADADERMRTKTLDAVDQTVADAVRALLAADADESCDPVLEPALLGPIRDGVGSVGGIDDRDAPEIAPDALGPRYVVRRLLGRGGFGSVYQARQVAPVERDVAVKVLHGSAVGASGGVMARRFASEQRTLASLDHPSIARFLDVVRTDAGDACLVMEYVDGEPITRFADRHRLGVRARVSLALQVCDAVEYAHRKAIIHRDLKPANVLVTASADDHGVRVPSANGRGPRVKVIDFGIAKALDTEAASEGTANAAETLTIRGQLLGTPGYMSPEQAAGDSIDTRTDVYALGAVLYELLTGTVPSSTTGSKSGSGTGSRKGDGSRSGAIARPSARFSATALGSDGTSATVLEAARLRASDRSGLCRTLRGELDWVVLRCLDDDRDRRYGSAAELGRDLRRYLSGDAIEARPPTLAYRASKFVRRNRLGIAAGAAVGVSLLAGTAAALAGLAAARDEARSARAQERIASASLAFLADDVLGAASPAGLGPETPIGEVLREAARALDAGRYADEPLVLATVRSAIGRMSYDLGLYDESIAQLERAAETWTRVMGPGSGPAVDDRARLGMSLSAAGRLGEAEAILVEALAAQRALHGAADARTVMTAASLGGAIELSGRVAEAIAFYERVFAEATGRLAEDDAAMLTLINNLAVAYSIAGRHGEAFAMFERALAACRASLGDDHPDTIIALSNAASALDSLDRISEASALYEEAHATARRVLGAAHPTTLGAANNLAYIWEREGRPGDAEALYRDTIEQRSGALGPGHRKTLNTVFSLGQLLLRSGRAEAALEQFERDLAGRRGLVDRGDLRGDHDDVLEAMAGVAAALDALGRTEEADRYRRDAARLRGDDPASP